MKCTHTDLEIAEICHEVNKAYCVAMGDFTQLPWEYAAEYQVQSALKGVKFHRDNQDVTPEQSHESWLREKESAGWKYGQVKSAHLKEHPCCVPYKELPKEQRAKDYIFSALVALLG